ncbi:unnamed protein product, partial [Tetraodon nigroviridis]
QSPCCPGSPSRRCLGAKPPPAATSQLAARGAHVRLRLLRFGSQVCLIIMQGATPTAFCQRPFPFLLAVHQVRPLQPHPCRTATMQRHKEQSTTASLVSGPG